MKIGEAYRKLKIVLLGSNAVGKTSLANRYTRNLFSATYINTIGCDIYVKNIDFRGEACKIVVHDIGGQLEFRAFRRKCLEDADIVMVVFALDDPGTHDVGDYVADILEMPSPPAWALVGNKSDLVEIDTLDLSLVKALAEKHGVPLHITSAKDGTSVQEAFLDLVGRRAVPRARGAMA
ncbi:MAG: GTP-binding protein [Candidatus Lokiarchaeota archaeon]|nr:GTP-binding protein [Candidatus Lokiarchaeota archaeon]